MADKGLMDVKEQLQKEEEDYIERSKNLHVSTIPSLMGVLYDYGMGYLERNPVTLRKSYAEPYMSKAQVMGSNLQNATQQLKSSISFVDLVDAFKEATNTPFKTLVPDPKSRGEK
jgi:hypothetical protein